MAVESQVGHSKVRQGSDRSFGFVFAVVFAVVAAWPMLDGEAPRWWALAVTAAFAGLALLWPRGLAPLNRLWFRFGLLLHHVISPLVMGAVFLIAVVPTALVFRLLGKDPMRRRPARDASTYWQPRDHTQASHMTNQF